MVRAAVCVLLVIGAALGPGGEAPDKEAAGRQRLEEMRRIAGDFTVRTAEGEEAQAVPLRPAPLLRFNDPTREFHDATLWAFGAEGRPVCLLAMEQYGGEWWFEIMSLVETDQQPPVTLSATGGPQVWKPQSAGLMFQVFPDAPKPAKEGPRRLIQMKDLMRQFTAHEVGFNKSRYELRLMAQPIARYSGGGVQDGAIFVFANGTNPELLGIIEAAGKDAETSAWRVAFMRCGTAEPHVLYKDKDIFTAPYARGTRPTEAYWNFRHTPRKPTAPGGIEK